MFFSSEIVWFHLTLHILSLPILLEVFRFYFSLGKEYTVVCARVSFSTHLLVDNEKEFFFCTCSLSSVIRFVDDGHSDWVRWRLKTVLI